MQPTIQFENVTARYGDDVALNDISLQVEKNEIFAIIGPAGSGKTTLLKCINRTLEFDDGSNYSGTVKVQGTDVKTVRNVYQLRQKIGMVFPLPVGLPLSIYENVAYAPRLAGMKKGPELNELIEKCLRESMLWDEVKDRLDMLGTKLSGGQQQRLTLARALSLQPDILCLDEFSIAIDPVTTMKIEDVLSELKEQMTIVLVTNLTQQAKRLSKHTAFINDSELVEVGTTEKMFSDPNNKLTYEYVTGEFG